MKLLFPLGAAMLCMTIAATAQDSTVKSQTKISADDAKVMVMTGCLRQNALTGSYSLVGTMAAVGDDVTTKSKVKTDVDRDDTKVTSETKITGDDKAVATTGALSTYALVPRSGVDLSAQVGHQVQLSAIAVEAGKGDADITVKDKTTVDPEHADAETTRSKTKVELPKSAAGSYSVVSMKPMPGACLAQ